jgi:hypothetical protein
MVTLLANVHHHPQALVHILLHPDARKGQNGKVVASVQGRSQKQRLVRAELRTHGVVSVFTLVRKNLSML